MKVSTGTSISPFYDPLIAKVIVSAPTREEAVNELVQLFSPPTSDGVDEKIVIQGPPNNLQFLLQVCLEDAFREGRVTTEWVVGGGVSYVPR